MAVLNPYKTPLKDRVFRGLTKGCTPSSLDQSAVLFYHQVKRERFQEHINFLKSNYSLISLDDLGEETGVAVTFDDGYVSNFKELYCILEEEDVPVTFFICPDLVGGKLNGRDLMDWNQIERLNDLENVSIESHGGAHIDLTSLSGDELVEELVRPIGTIQNELGSVVKYIACPYGCYNDEVVDKVRGLYSRMFTINPRHFKGGLEVGRYPVYHDSPVSEICGCLNGWRTRLSRIWRFFR